MTNKTYECHKGPPQVTSELGVYRGIWPPITPERWCGEHKFLKSSSSADVKCCNNCRYARLIASGHP